MAIAKTTGVVDTPIEGVSSLSFPRGLVNFGADFKVKSNTPGKEVVITNITAPLDSPETFRFAYSDIKNIYSGVDIDVNLMSPSKAGLSALVELKEVFTVTDATNPELRIQLPVSYHVVVKVPKSGYLTGSDIMAGLGRLVSGLFDTGATTTSRLDAILRGSLVPTSL